MFFLQRTAHIAEIDIHIPKDIHFKITQISCILYYLVKIFLDEAPITSLLIANLAISPDIASATSSASIITASASTCEQNHFNSTCLSYISCTWEGVLTIFLRPFPIRLIFARQFHLHVHAKNKILRIPTFFWEHIFLYGRSIAFARHSISFS